MTNPSLTEGEVTESQEEQAEVTKHSSVEAQLKDHLISLRFGRCFKIKIVKQNCEQVSNDCEGHLDTLCLCFANLYD